MYGRHFLSISDYTKEEILKILERARDLKADLKSGVERPLLKGKSLAMIFQKPSNRTRVSFEVGMYQLGGKTVNITGAEIKMGERESVADIARVFSRYVDGVMLRALFHSDVVEFAENSSVPVINGLSDLFHPCQAVADVLTMREKLGAYSGFKVCYIGDGNNVCNSIIHICNLLGIELVVTCPKGYEPAGEERLASCVVIRDPREAAQGAHVLYTDVWTSMGQEEEAKKRRRDFRGYTVTRELMKVAAPEALFMHCLPAHRGEEVEAEVFESKSSVVFDQAENRLHAQKGILALLLGK